MAPEQGRMEQEEEVLGGFDMSACSLLYKIYSWWFTYYWGAAETSVPATAKTKVEGFIFINVF
jgi:hypothetical protein